ncbi:xylose isomerase [Ktedonobacter sp. SOSP1-85]|uniref:sugar phosphate isomerase/epimerase family protein n=1 Tax=Ktedonobacter sp. SOSP1-85 TaxID=2778367 RepID=UPI0019163DBC|nr:sugar phosphate isomerase/epimerase family protein [Ktedonobacter sp. SOSP1-85]GHO73883.1 xylose isomerase [Ktedonobacter sp. SOSP1-85]
MIRISAFADEISPDLDEQIAVLSGENIHFMELRGAWNTNVLDFSDQQLMTIKEKLDAHGIGVSSIGSPIGKVAIDSSFEEHLRRLERAIEVAHVMQTPFIRMFSFYPPKESEAANPAAYRDEVLKRLREMIARARAANVVLLHENEKDIYGDTIARCVDLFQSCDDKAFRSILDPANYIQCGQTPYPDAYEATRPWLDYVHVKDADAEGKVTPAGEGVARWPELLQRLRADGYDGFLSLEPHLANASQYKGFSGPDLFRCASQALQKMLQAMDWQYA